MMRFTRQELQQLVAVRQDLCLSIFLPTHRAGRQQQQDKIRLKNLIGRARQLLAERDIGGPQADDLVGPVGDLQSDWQSWNDRWEGLAIFRAPGFLRSYSLPEKCDESLMISTRFHIRPLLPLLGSGRRFYILALTQESARLYEATRYSLRELELPEIERTEVDGKDDNLQYRAHRAPGMGKGATDEALFHGHGGPSDRSKKDILNYFHRVDEAVGRLLRGESEPLILASVGYIASLYEDTNSYRGLIRAKLPGSPDRWKPDELRERAWSIVEPHFRGEQDDAIRSYDQARGSSQASEDVREVVLAAATGRVDKLLLARGEERWGQVDVERQAVFVADHVGDPTGEGSCDELLDYAASETLRQRGAVFALDQRPVPDSPVAAVMRY